MSKALEVARFIAVAIIVGGFLTLITFPASAQNDAKFKMHTWSTQPLSFNACDSLEVAEAIATAYEEDGDEAAHIVYIVSTPNPCGALVGFVYPVSRHKVATHDGSTVYVIAVGVRTVDGNILGKPFYMLSPFPVAEKTACLDCIPA